MKVGTLFRENIGLNEKIPLNLASAIIKTMAFVCNISQTSDTAASSRYRDLRHFFKDEIDKVYALRGHPRAHKEQRKAYSYELRCK